MIKNDRTNGIKVEKRDAEMLLNSYSIKDIETSLIKIFMEQNNLKTKNTLLLDVLKKNHENIKMQIYAYLIDKKIELNLKTLERFFELLIEPEDRKLNGAFYTPSFIVDYISEQTISGDENVCDLSCGSGAFLVGAVQRINKITKKSVIDIIENNLFGGDISSTSVYRAKIILSLLALTYGEDKANIKFNLIVGDSLSHNWLDEHPDGFDVIIGNPPYVRIQNMKQKEREYIKSKYLTASKGNVDLFIPFFELAVTLLSINGKMGYITPNSYLNSRASKKLRQYLQDIRYISKILDFNHLQIFEGVTTYTCITILDRKRKDNLLYRVIHDKNLLLDLDNLKFANIKLNHLSVDNWNLLNPEDYENIKKIETIGVPLGKVAQIKNGIATLKDDLYILEGDTKEGHYIARYEGQEYLIEKEITRKIVKASILKDERDVENTKKRIIFPYEKTGTLYKPLTEEKLKKEYPKTYQYFLAIRKDLAKRDKGKRQYDEWFAYGRVQGYNITGPKIISPLMSPEPRFAICNEDKTLYHGGIGIFYPGNLEVLQKVLKSKVFWYYILKTSKEYKSDFRAVANNFIEKFNIPKLTNEEIEFMKKESSQEKINNFLVKKYGLSI